MLLTDVWQTIGIGHGQRIHCYRFIEVLPKNLLGSGVGDLYIAGGGIYEQNGLRHLIDNADNPLVGILDLFEELRDFDSLGALASPYRSEEAVGLIQHIAIGDTQVCDTNPLTTDAQRNHQYGLRTAHALHNGLWRMQIVSIYYQRLVTIQRLMGEFKGLQRVSFGIQHGAISVMSRSELKSTIIIQ